MTDDTEEVLEQIINPVDVVWNIRLFNGEDVLGRIKFDDDKNCYFVRDPMVMHEIETDAGTATSMLRYIAGAAWNHIFLTETSIITMIPINKELSAYYDKCVEYCEKVSDKRFRKATQLATGQIEVVIRRNIAPDEVSSAISETEFMAMPVEGLA